MGVDEMVRVDKGQRVSVGNAAMTMAIGIIVERIGRLSDEDQKDLYELVKGLQEAKDPIEVEAIRVAMGEILDQDAGAARVMDLAKPTDRPERLQRWVDYVADRIKSLRKAAGLTQIELAQKSGLPQSHISRIESAKLSPSHVTLEKIAAAMGAPMNSIDPSA